MCLIDPQCHTSEDPKFSTYWDGGISKIKKFLHEHGSACDKNWVCKALQLKNVVVQSKTPEPSPKAVEGAKTSLTLINDN